MFTHNNIFITRKAGIYFVFIFNIEGQYDENSNTC